MLQSTCTSRGDFCFGTVKIGEYPTEITAFRIAGVERRWDWCEDGRSYDCAFVIRPGGSLNGRYFNFWGSKDGRAKASGFH